MKLYIIPSGWDKELVMKTVFKSGCDKVCLINAKKKKNHVYSKISIETIKNNEKIRKVLTKFTEVDVLDVDYIDFEDIFIKINEYIKQHKDAEIVVNVSTGSHLVSATLLFAAFVNDLKVEYSIAKGYDNAIFNLIKKGRNFHKGFEKVIVIPTLSLNLKLSNKDKEFLKKANERNILDVSSYIEKATGNNENRLRSDFHYRIKKLEGMNLIKVNNGSKKVEVSLSDLGRVFIQHL